MRKTIIKEFIWLAGCLVAAFLLFEFERGNSALDINLHDTYIYLNGHTQLYESSSLYLLFSVYHLFNYFITVTFWVYLIRAIYWKFDVAVPNVILLISTGFMIFSTSGSVSISSLLAYSSSSYTDSPAPVKGLFYGNDVSALAIVVNYCVSLALILLFAFIAYTMGRKRKKLSS